MWPFFTPPSKTLAAGAAWLQSERWATTMRAALLILCGFAACHAQFDDDDYEAEPTLFQWPGLRAISPSANTCQWSQSTALLEAGTDVSIFLDSFDAAQPHILDRISAYETQPWLDLKPAMEYALAAGELYRLPGLSSALQSELAARVRLVADAALAVRNDALVNPDNELLFMWVEQRNMRGWPHFIKDEPKSESSINHQGTCTPADAFLNNWNDAQVQAQCKSNCAFDHTNPFIDAYHNGFVLHVVALAAEFAAKAGDHAAAARYIAGAAEPIYDRYFKSRDASLLDSSYRLVALPNEAKKDRRRRWMLKTCEFDCFDLPDAHNHGIVAATAAFHLREAMQLVDWSHGIWPLSGQVSQDAFRAELKAMVQGSASLLTDDMVTTSTGARAWKYRANVQSCPSLGAKKDRYDDISHSRHAMGFLALLHSRAPNAYGISEDLVERVLRTFLETMVHPQGDQFFDGRRFACDLMGTTDVNALGQVLAESQLSETQAKSCRASRAVDDRVTFATQWSYLAAALSNPSQRCNSVNVVATVFPMLLQGSPYLGQGYVAGRSGKEALLAAAAINAKYWFYNYDAASSCCDNHAIQGPTVFVDAGSKCKDKGPKCEKKQRKGKCGKRKMQKKCQKTCGICGATTAVG